MPKLCWLISASLNVESLVAANQHSIHCPRIGDDGVTVRVTHCVTPACQKKWYTLIPDLYVLNNKFLKAVFVQLCV